MTKIPLDKLEAGMKLAKSVENASGMVLLGENTELTVELINKIKDMDIDGVYVHSKSKPSLPIESMLLQLEDRFSAVEGKPYMDILKKALKEHIESLYE